MIMRSANVPLIAFVGVADDVFAVAPWRPATVFHLMPVGNPAPPRPRRPDWVTSSMMTPGLASALGEPFVAAMRFVVVERARIDDAAAGEGEAGLLLEERMLLRRADAQFVIAAASDHGIEHAVDVGESDRAVGDAAFVGRDLDA